jgi:hypothetical protein
MARINLFYLGVNYKMMKTLVYRLNDNKGYAAMVGSIIALVIAVIMIGTVVMPTIKGVNASVAAGWTTSEIALWGILGLLVIVSLYQILGAK